jgi:hypothetical protein
MGFAPRRFLLFLTPQIFPEKHAHLAPPIACPQNKRKCEVLDEVLKGQPPLFHRWLLGKFTEPAAWLNARLAYTRTAGETSGGHGRAGLALWGICRAMSAAVGQRRWHGLQLGTAATERHVWLLLGESLLRAPP